MNPDISPETMNRLEALGSKLESIEQSPSYINAMLAMLQYQKDNFEMIDRSLTMMQAVHKAELQNSAFYVDIIKFSAPIFATATITGAALDTPGINSSVLIAIGSVGLLTSVIALVPLLIQRHKKAKRQNAEYIKLAEAFDGWKKVAELRKQLETEGDLNPQKTKELFSEIMQLANMDDIGDKK